MELEETSDKEPHIWHYLVAAQITKIPSLNQVKDDEDDEDWGVDLNEDAVAKRLKEQTDAIQRLTMNEDLEKTANERMNLFYVFLKVWLNSIYCSWNNWSS